MASKVTLILVSESQQGNIGNDWKYTLHAKVYNEDLKGEGSIEVKKHMLSSGQTQQPPGPPEALVMDAGNSGKELCIKLNLKATEVDLFKNDSGEHSVTLTMNTPASGAAAITVNSEISVGVRESPGIVDQSAVMTLKLQLTSASD